jgi:hypothetical protein
MPAGDLPEGEPKAVTLIDDLPSLEVELLVALTGAEKIRSFQPCRWEDVGENVLVPMWTAGLGTHRARIAGTTPAGLAGAAARSPELGRAAAEGQLSDEEARGAGTSILGAAFAVALHRQGWRIETEPGEPIRARKGGAVLEPFTVVERLASGKLAPDGWARECDSLGIAAIDLTPPEGGPAA